MNVLEKLKTVLSHLLVHLAILVLLVLLPAVVILSFSFRDGRRLAMAEARAKAMLVARSEASGYERVIEGSRHLLMALSQTNAVQERDAARSGLIFARLLKRLPGYANIGISGPDGNIFASAVPLKAPVNVSDRSWYRRVIETKKFAAGDYQIGRVVSRPVMVFAYPVLDDAGVLRSLVFCSLDLEWLNDSLDRLKFKGGEDLLMVDSKGVILARHPDNERWSGKELPDQTLVRAMLGRKEGVGEFTGLDGVRRLYAFAGLNTGPEQNLHLAFGLPAPEAFAAARNVFFWNIVLLLLLGAVALTAGYYYSEAAILGPMRSMVSTADSLSQGDLGRRAAGIHGFYEIQRLMDSFNRMAGAIQARDLDLREGEKKYRRLFDSITDAFVLVDMQGRIKEFNPAYANMLGYSETEIRQITYMDVTPEKWHKFEAEIVKNEVLPKGSSGVYEKEYRRKNGEVFPVELRTFLIRDDKNTPLAMWAIIRDISARRLAELELRNLNAELEERVLRRTAQLETANKGLEAFAYSVSHDLRAPLRLIAAYARLVEERAGLKGEDAANLAVVISSAAKLGRMVSGVLEYSKLGVKETAFGKVDMQALAGSVIAEVRNLSGGGRAVFSLGPLPPCLGSETMLRQVLVNLLGNAVKYSAGREKPLIELGGAEGAAENAYFIKDNGAGFDQAYTGRLFSLFGRLHAEDKFEGLGLGLAIVKRIITGHGGTIKAEGKPGAGATFTFTLPRRGIR